MSHVGIALAADSTAANALKTRLLFALMCLSSVVVGIADAPAAEPAAGTQPQVARAARLLDGWEGSGNGLRLARTLLDEALADNPDSAQAYREYARYYMMNGYVRRSIYEHGALEAAERSLDKAIALSPEYAEAHVLRGHLYEQMERPDQARLALERAEQLGTDDPWLHLNWADVLLDEHRYDEAADRYRKVLASGALDRHVEISAREGLIQYYKHTKQLDKAEQGYRELIARVPDSAWVHGNFAAYMLCWQEDYRTAIAEAEKARSLMDYGIARLTLSAALYRQWAQEVLDGKEAEAERTWKRSEQVLAAEPSQAIGDICGGGAAVMKVLTAMRKAGMGARIEPMAAVMLAADSDAKVTPGIFIIDVQATGRSGGDLFLNSEPDYRDQRNLSIRILPKAQAELRRRHGADIDALFEGFRISVLGWAVRTRIDFTNDGLPTGKYYYQTHVVVNDADQIEVVEGRPAP
jgi:Tfp pilus assembly protein PilF